VRPASRADLLEVFRIEQAAFPQPWPYGAFEGFLGQEGFLVAADDTGVVGYVVADTVPNHGRPLGHVKDIAVHPDRRGEGLGATLLERALEVLRATRRPSSSTASSASGTTTPSRATTTTARTHS
jgi:ribosomal-protein-alanine N-acetyltransferase